MQKEFQENLKESIRHLQIADHMAYVTYPLVNEKRLLLKIFEEINKSIMYSINSMIIYENLTLGNDEDFIKNFLSKYGKDYDLTNEKIKKIFEIIDLHKRYKESAMDFVRKDKIVIMSDSLKIQSLNISRIKEYLLLSKEIITGINERAKKRRFVIN